MLHVHLHDGFRLVGVPENEEPDQRVAYTEVWYDRSQRLWCAIRRNKQGHQIGNAGYGPTKELAKKDLD